MPAAASRHLSDGDDRFLKMISRLRPTQLGPGEVAVSENGRMDEDGVWMTREGYKSRGGITFQTTNVPLLVGEGEAGALDLIGILSGGCTASGTTTVTVDTSATGDWRTGDPGHTVLLNLSGFTGGTGTLDGNRTATWVSDTSFTVSVAGVSGSWTGGTVGPFKLSGDQVTLRGACLFSDPDDSNLDYIIIADNAQATAIKISNNFAQTTIAYPSGETLDQVCDLNQEFDVVVLRQKGKTSWYFDPDDATYGFGGSDPDAPLFRKFATGAATQHSIYDTATNTAFADGVATVTETAHGRAVGDKVLIVSATNYEFLEGTTVEIATVPGANSFTYYVDVEDDAGTSVVYSTRASLGGGFVEPPGAAFGVYHAQRSWVHYNYDSESTPAHRGIEDEIIASDILSHVYDPIENQFRIAGGTADYVVAMHGYDADRLIVFMRNSIHYLSGVSGSLDDVEKFQLTNRIGCVARKSVVQTPSNQILFLADNGVYAISFADELNLRGVDIPLSEAVDSIIKRITPGSADLATGVYHDNRYWLALPLDGNDFNSHILIFNFFTGGWESLDSTQEPASTKRWAIEELLEAKSGKVNELYAVTQSGGLHQLTKTNADSDTIAGGLIADKSYTIASKLVTRQYGMRTIRRKKFNRLRVHFKSDSTASQGDLTVITEDPDLTVDMGAIRDEFSGGLSANEDGTFHKRIGNPRGHAIQFQFEAESGRPAVRAVQIDAHEAESTNSFT